MKKSFIFLFLLAPLFSYSTTFAVETAPRISDREIIEGLSTIRGDVKELRVEIKRLDEGQKASANELRASVSSSVNELRTEIKRLDEGQKALEKRFGERFDVLQWMLGLFITVAISLMGIMGRILWTQQKRLTQIEITLEAQKEEISFIKALIEKLQGLIEKLLPPRSVL
mgnify:FL=1